MATKATAVDLGSHSSKVLVAQAGKHGIKVLRFAGLPHGEGGNSVPLRQAGIPLAGSIVGLAGRDMTLRYSQVPPTPDWQLRNLMELEIQDLAQQSGGALSADFNLLPSQDAEATVDTVLLALAKDEALDRLQGEVRAAGGAVAAFVPNCTALYNAYLKCGPVEADSVACLVHIGHQTMDLAIVKGTDLLFARNLGSGAKVLDDALAASFNVGERKAEALKKDLLDLDPQSRGRYASGQAEKVTLAATSAAGSISAAIQSSLAFCKSQTKLADLRLDRVLLSGGGARLRGIRGFLREVLRCPVELFDPFANLDLSALPPADAEQLAAMRHEAVVALGLAVGRLDDTLYSLEILPEAVRKAQRFKQRTVWNVLAGVLVAAAVFLQYQHGQKKASAAELARGKLNRAVAQANSIHAEAQDLIDKNKEQRSVVEHLAATALPLQGMLRVQRAVQQHLPAQVWIEKFEVQGGGGVQKKKPAVVVEAAGKELNGVTPSRVWLEFMQKLRTDPGMAGLNPVMKELPKTDGAERWSVTVDLMEVK
ncbi:MAG: pilus assembly protein PilM [Planctomycetes bacterium]|nr:pilus assembly protein PilM [Planctomycetota bacterium]